jgi:hypothetical protein
MIIKTTFLSLQFFVLCDWLFGPSLTVSDLQQGLGDDRASDVEGLAAVVAHI